MDGAPELPSALLTRDNVPNATLEVHAMSKALKEAGSTFVEPTICYAFMQCVGMVDDHVVGCLRYRGPEN